MYLSHDLFVVSDFYCSCHVQGASMNYGTYFNWRYDVSNNDYWPKVVLFMMKAFKIPEKKNGFFKIGVYIGSVEE